MGEGDVRSARRIARAIVFGAGSALDLVAAPFEVLRRKRRVAAEVLRDAGWPASGAWRRDAARRVLARRHRRFSRRLRRDGPSGLSPLLDVEGEGRLRSALAAGHGALVLATHGGPPFAVSAALVARGYDPLVMHTRVPPHAAASRVALVEMDGPPSSRARVLLACLDELRRGGVVYAALEGVSAVDAAAPLAADGWVLRFAGGAAALARRSRAVVLPTVASVSASGRLRVVFGEPLAAPDPRVLPEPAAQADFAARANEAFEVLLRDDPVQRFERRIWSWRIARMRTGQRAFPSEDPS